MLVCAFFASPFSEFAPRFRCEKQKMATTASRWDAASHHLASEHHHAEIFIPLQQLAMSDRANGGDSSDKAHKRHAAAPQDESPLPSATSSLALQASSSSIPNIPLDLIADLILPFVADRSTWNSMYCASKYLCLAGKKMTPPWPNTTPNFGQAVRLVVFSPSGSQLALVYNRVNTHQDVVHVWDRWGKEALLAGRTRVMHCLEYSWDGEYLASGCQDGSIRLWNTESFHAASSKISRETPTREPSQADIILAGTPRDAKALSFSRTDSNLLASGGSTGEIKRCGM